MKNIAHRTVVQDNYFTQVRFDAAEVLDVGAVAKRAVLAIVAADEVLAFLFQPVDHRVGVLLHTGGKNDQFVPLAHLAKELFAVRSLVHVVEDRVLWADDSGWWSSCLRRRQRHRRVQLHLHHVTRGHAVALGQGMDKGFVQVEDQCLLLEAEGRVTMGMSMRDEVCI